MPKLELKGFLNHSYGTWYPTGCLVAVIDEPQEAARAVEELHSAGFQEDDIRLFLGPEAVETRAQVERQQDLVERVAYAFASVMSTEADAMKHYLEHAERGSAIVAVRCPQPTILPGEPRDASHGKGDDAVLVLAAHHAHDWTYYHPGHMVGIGW